MDSGDAGQPVVESALPPVCVISDQVFQEEKQAVEQFGSSDSGASLGDILGAAMKRRDTDDANA